MLFGIIWAILIVLSLALITNYDSTKSDSSQYQNTVYSLVFFQFIPSIFPVVYYLKKKSVSKISYVVLGLLYTWLFIMFIALPYSEEVQVEGFSTFLILLIIIPVVGFFIWIRSKITRNISTKTNPLKNNLKTDTDTSYDSLKKQITNYDLKKEIDEHENQNHKTVSKQNISEQTKPLKKGIADLLKLSESETLEFKSTLKWDIRQDKSNSALVMECIKTIAGFLNNRGGILIVGYDDDNNVVYGLEKDYPITSKKQNFDGWQQYFINQINDKLGKTINHYFTIETIPYNGKTLAKIDVQASPEPVFTKEQNNEGNFYVRIHGQTENLNPQESQKWISEHFGN